MQPSDKVIQHVIDAARRSPCMKSKRGAAVVGADGTLVAAWNTLPRPFQCDGSEACRRDCGERCVHAEEQALLIAASAQLLRPCEVVHIKVAPDPSATAATVDADVMRALNVSAGLAPDAVAPPVPLMPVPSGPPSCIECAKLMLSIGITAVWLLHENGWRRYPTEAFYRLTLKELGLKED